MPSPRRRLIAGALGALLAVVLATAITARLPEALARDDRAARVAGLEEEIGAASESSAGLQDRIADARSELRATERRVAILRVRQGRQSRTLGRLKGEVAEAQAKLDELRA